MVRRLLILALATGCPSIPDDAATPTGDPVDSGEPGDTDQAEPGPTLTVDPSHATRGLVVEVEITGDRTAWDHRSWARFGPGTRVLGTDVVDAGFAIAELAIRPDAEPGARDVGVDDVVRTDAFEIDQDVITAELEIGPVPQGEVVSFTLSGRGTAWGPGLSVTVLDAWGPNPDLQVIELQPVSGAEAFGRIQASNAAAPGFRDLLVTQGDQRLYLPDALEVVETEPPLDEVVLYLRWHLTREVDARGRWVTSADARATFVVPLDPPCGAPPPPEGGGGGFDEIIVRQIPEPFGRSGDCPTPRTLDAGPHVWLRSEGRAVRLDRTEPRGGAFITYRPAPDVAADYPFGEALDFVADGSDRVPAFELPEVFLAVPGEVTLLGQSETIHPRDRDLAVTWLPTKSYPHADLDLDLRAVGLAGGDVSLVTRPWDDGLFVYPFSALTTLEPAMAELRLRSRREGRAFSLPFSEIIQPLPETSVQMRRRVILE